MTDVINPPTDLNYTPIPPYVPGMLPFTNITPFTYRDGVTFLEKVESFQAYINSVYQIINDNFDMFDQEFIDAMNALIAQINQMFADQDAEFDQKIQDLEDLILSNGVALQDPVMYGILSNPNSQSGAYTRQLIDNHGVMVPSLVGPIQQSNYTGTLPIEYHNGQLWGINGTSIQTSGDDGVTWTTVAVAPAGSVSRILWCNDGEVLVVNGSNVWKSQGWTNNPSGVQWAIKVTKSMPTGVGILQWGFDGDGNKFIVTEYSGVDRSESRYVWISIDKGNTFNIVYDNYVNDPGHTSHFHGCCYDPWDDRFWVSQGHGTMKGMYYSNNNGSTWTFLTGPFQPDAAPCAMVATNDGIVLGSDSGNDAGIYGIPRVVNIAHMQMRKNSRWVNVEDGVPGFANRAFRDPNTGIVYIGYCSEFADVAGTIAAGMARGGSFLWNDPTIGTTRSANPLVTNDGTLIAYIDRYGSYDLLTAQALKPASTRNIDAGNTSGGVALNSSSLAMGPNASAPAAARYGIAIGTGAVAQNQGDIAIGYQAGANTAPSTTNGTQIGSGSVTSSRAIALGNATSAVSDSIALGDNTAATQSFTENIGARSRVRKRLLGDAHMAVPAVDEVQEYTIMVNTRLASYHQMRDGRRVKVGNYGTLAELINVNAKTVALTPLFTCPSGATGIIEKIIVRCTAAAAITVAPSVSVGVTPGDVMPTTALTGLTSAASKGWIFTPNGLITTIYQNQVVNFSVDVAATGTSQSFSVEVLGYLM